MSDEIKLHQAAQFASRAQDLLENELLTSTFKHLEESYVAAWRSTLIEDVTGREKLFLAINVVGKVRDHLMHAVVNGKIAMQELKDLAETAERQKA